MKNLEAPTGILLIVVAYLSVFLVVNSLLDEYRRDQRGYGRYEGINYTINTIRFCAKQGFPTDSANVMIKRAVDSLRNEINVDAL